jgi:serine/threonine protein kinase
VFSQGTLPPSCHSCWVLATAKEFCTAVAYLHSMDVVHGDLKSSNVLLKAAAVTPWDSRGFVAKVCLGPCCTHDDYLGSVGVRATTTAGTLSTAVKSKPWQPIADKCCAYTCCVLYLLC